MKVQVTIEAPIVQYPVGTTTSGTLFTLNAPAGAETIPAQKVDPGVMSAEFDGVPDGAGYSVTAQLVDANGSPLGVAATSELFDVATPTVGIATPSVIHVTVQM